MSEFRMGSLDHVHLVVPDRSEAARWYQETLGFTAVEACEPWTRIEGGPLHLSADGGRSGIALFQLGQGHGPTTLEMGAAFRVDAKQFLAFARGLDESGVRGVNGDPLAREALIDFDLGYAYRFQDPWGNRFELNCYDVDTVRRELIDAEGIEAVRYW